MSFLILYSDIIFRNTVYKYYPLITKQAPLTYARGACFVIDELNC